jgi:hypothetical protein
VWNRQAAVADFDPAPQLDAVWADVLKPFRAVPRKDFGFKIIVRVVEDAQAEMRWEPSTGCWSISRAFCKSRAPP